MFPDVFYTSRYKTIENTLKEQELDAWISFRYESRRYLSGFTGSAGILVLKPEPTLLVDFRYTEQAKNESPGVKVIEYSKPYHKYLKEVLDISTTRRVGFEAQNLTFFQHRELKEFIPEVEWIPLDNLVENLRMVKEPQEIAAIKEAQLLAESALESILPLIKPGVKEIDIAVEFEHQIRTRGALIAFPVIVASGPRAALPHAQPTTKEIEDGDMVVLDFGARVKGYVSDCTRTYHIGKPKSQDIEIYEAVLKAQEQSLQAIKSGIESGIVDKAARDYLKGRNLDHYFGHGLGHGVGLEVHEAPRAAIDEKTILQKGMVLTIEPGVYIPGWGGVRIEDLAVVIENGFENLTKLTKKEWIL